MSENLIISKSTDKVSRYESLIPQIEALILGEPDLIANLANVTAALKQTFDFFWVGFYFVKNDELVLGPFQGPIACTRIQRGKGVCGTSWQRGETIIVEDVDEFPGHIACNLKSRSEIVVPAFKNGQIFLILDIDNERLNYFDKTDAEWLEKLMGIISNLS